MKIGILGAGNMGGTLGSNGSLPVTPLFLVYAI